MTVKKTTERTRQPKRTDKASATQNGEFDREEVSYIFESIYGVRYPKQVIASSLAKALVLE